MNALIDWTKFPPDVIEILLRDFNGGRKIFDGDIANVVPRALKSDDEKSARTRSIAEVFTPPHVVKFMVDAALVDSPIDSRWIEIACGEAPFITTRYDAESGEAIPVPERVGILDRKLRAIPANVDKLNDVKRAVQSVYGYELQGDSLLIARANVLLTAAEVVTDIKPDELRELAEIVARNFWQMDGLKVKYPEAQIPLILTNDDFAWYLKEGNRMKFDVLISNPPYQDDTPSGDNKTFAPPIYHHFLREARKVADKSVLITPARFLFDAGATPKKFNRDMLNDPHLKVLDYAPDATKYFRNVDIKGGVVVTLYDTTRTFGAIGVFTPYEELNSIHRKVCVENTKFRSFNELIYSRKIFKLTEKFYVENPDAPTYLKDKNGYTIGTNAFAEMPEYFFDDEPNDGHEHVQVIGLLKGRRVFKWIRRDYVNSPAPFDKFKVLMPSSSGAGTFGDTLSTPFVCSPSICCTETFITIGAFDSRDEAEACLTYIKSKFARAMLGILKVTQHNTRDTWAKVPLQDFTAGGDIDWRGEVDEQLYRKYALSAAEVDFIESHVKAM